ncbi:UNVERIFIED_ORG: hypothetical protein J2Y81_000766 [Paraburkholderia sediminicola]|nr:hypothetical protein [Paraburkholderia sediminicola]
MHALHERAHENERRVLTYLASFDCLPKRLIALLLHGEETNSSITYADKITKRMISRGLIGRKIAGDGVYRYFLAERGTYEAAEVLTFEPKNGFERSYLNAARFDVLHETVIKDMYNKSGVGLGKGALRHLFENRLHDVDAALTVADGDTRRFEYFYLKIDTLAETSLERFDRVKRLASQHHAKIKIVGPDFIRKKLAKR